MLSDPSGREAELRRTVKQSWFACGVLVFVLGFREVTSRGGGPCALSASDLSRGEAFVKSEVAWLQQHTTRASEDADEMLAALAEELAEVEALSNSLVARGAKESNRLYRTLDRPHLPRKGNAAPEDLSA